jgi:hypothetical protein
VFASGTLMGTLARLFNPTVIQTHHHKLDAPSMIRLTAIKYVSSEKGFGGRPKIGVDAYIGSALPIEELVKLTMNGWIDMTLSIAIFRQNGRFNGSAGSADGCGTRRISS